MFRKSYFYYAFVIVIAMAIISISSCEKDEVFENSRIELIFPEIQGRFVKGKDLLHTPIIGDKINSLSSNVFNKSNNSSDIQIDTSRIQLIESMDYKSYTFQIVQDSIERKILLRNYMLTVVNDTTTFQHLINYEVLTNGDYNMTNIQVSLVTGDSLIPSFLKCGMTTTLAPTIECYSWSCGGSTGNGEHEDGDSDCEAQGADRAGSRCVKSWIFVRGSSPCDGGGGAPSGGGGFAVPIIPVEDLAPVGTNIQNFFDTELSDDLRDYINNIEQNYVRLPIKDYFKVNGLIDETKEVVKDFLEIQMDNRLVKLERYVELIELLETDPFALIEDCLAQSGLDTQEYIDLYNHTIPSSCVNRLMNLGGISSGYINQPIWQGNVPLANIDYYGIEITTMPDLDGDGNLDTAQEVFNAYKDNFLDFASGSQDDFQFASNIPLDFDNIADISWEFSPLIDPDDLTTFNSIDPITAIFIINGNATGVAGLSADSGAVILSDYQSGDQWTVSTIETPQTGSQPFSGNRQWGITTNAQGNIELFTRAVDVARMSSLIELDFRNEISDKQTDYYNIANATWENLQTEIISWVNENGGQASLSLDTTVIKVDKTKIKELLEGNETIDQINCN
ncbi:hypothetical protein [Nonlabens sp.]|uniref:hypothetical protein n=1 Tax=Nonlabens sp. TaxID=1888209 RepID=UPI003F69CC39